MANTECIGMEEVNEETFESATNQQGVAEEPTGEMTETAIHENESEDVQGEKNAENIEDKTEKEIKSKKRLSIFRKSKKEKKSETEEPADEGGFVKEDNKENILDDVTVEKQEKTSRWKRKSGKKNEIPVKESTTQTPTSHDTKEETAEAQAEEEEEGKIVSKKLRSMFKRKSNRASKTASDNAVTQTVETAEEVGVEEDVVAEKPKKTRMWKRRSEKKTSNEVVATQTENVELEKETTTGEEPCEDVDDSKTKAEEKGEISTKPRRRSLMKKFKKNTKTTKSDVITDENEKHVDEESKMKKEENIEDGELRNNPFHDWFEENRIEEVTEPEVLLSPEEPINPIDEEDGGVYTGDEYLTEPEESKVEVIEIKVDLAETEDAQDETNESDLTTVTALPDINSDAFTASVEAAKETIAVADKEEIKGEEEGGEEEEKEEEEEEGTSENAIEISKENVEPDAKSENKEENKCQGFVLVDHLNDKQKDESYILAKKALNAYRKGQLNHAYCQACCTLIFFFCLEQPRTQGIYYISSDIGTPSRYKETIGAGKEVVSCQCFLYSNDYYYWSFCGFWEEIS
ncbi:DNA ligase 1-like [Hydractinia symbiolongicarpus]|uniref:DNA ligase 1-like n=1 Tax=Hydractinia symbiolongicarpus TaxID=13093 RepID=UPI00254A699D|nr:DNA ligase 1-like [Hydractinia symbiolongicarpus]